MKNIILVFMITIFIISCQNKIDPNVPPEIQYGIDLCDECGMIISEPRFSSAYITQGGLIKRFDDIGGMLLYNDKEKENVLTFWVRDYENENWISSDLAKFIINSDITTPMAHGIVAVEDLDRAKEIAIKRDGKVVTFDEVLDHHNSMDHSDHHHSMDHTDHH